MRLDPAMENAPDSGDMIHGLPPTEQAVVVEFLNRQLADLSSPLEIRVVELAAGRPMLADWSIKRGLTQYLAWLDPDDDLEAQADRWPQLGFASGCLSDYLDWIPPADLLFIADSAFLDSLGSVETISARLCRVVRRNGLLLMCGSRDEVETSAPIRGDRAMKGFSLEDRLASPSLELWIFRRFGHGRPQKGAPSPAASNAKAA